MGSCCGARRVYTEADPLVVGDPVGPTLQVIASVSVIGLRPNQVVWARGSTLQKLIDAGWIRPA